MSTSLCLLDQSELDDISAGVDILTPGEAKEQKRQRNLDLQRSRRIKGWENVFGTNPPPPSSERITQEELDNVTSGDAVHLVSLMSS